MKKARVEYRYAAGVDDVFPLLATKRALVDRFEAQGARDIEVVEYDDSGDAVHLVAHYVVSVDVPGFAKRVLSPETHITHTETWKPTPDGGRSADFQISVKGLPSSMTGTSALVPEGSGCRSVTDAEIVVSIPLLGGKLEQMGLDRLHEDLASVDGYLTSHTT